LDWRERLAGLRRLVLDDVPVLLVLDNFEDNLTDQAAGGNGWRTVRDGALAELVGSPARCRLLVTCRYPFTLPGAAERVLSFKHIGPLSFAETLKLAWALPGLDRLGEPELEQVWRMVGGHPRSLEYLDALLCGGRSNYPDVTRRLASTLRDRLGVEDLDTWFAEHSQLDPALIEILTLAADDVLLDRLLAGLAEVPGAERLLLGASVYRSAVDQAALLFQVGEEDLTAEHIPDRRAAQRRIADILTAAGVPLDGPIDFSALADPLQQRIAPYWGELHRLPTPPRRAPGDLRRLVETCAASSLLTLDTSAAQPTVFVHRWTATELHRRWVDRGYHDRVANAHLCAVDYWRWRVKAWPSDLRRAMDDLLEARYHFLAAGQADAAATFTEHVCLQLHAWGAWDREESLIHDTLAHLPTASDRYPTWLSALGDIAVGRGRSVEAASRYRQSLAISERLVRRAPDNRDYQRNLSICYERLGDLDLAAGRPGEAVGRYRQGLVICERLVQLAPDDADYQRGLSVSYDKLGDLELAAGRPREAAHRY
jgi:tetratricopeptide (TPR) repeat protein